MKKLLAILMILVLIASFAIAKEGNNMDIGLRGGVRSGIVGRLWTENNAIEATLGYNNGLIVTGVYEWHKPLKLGELEGLSWYYGGGAHLGISSWWAAALALGIDGVIGVEYDLKQHINLPLSVSLDWKPGLDILGGWAGHLGNTGLAVRWTF